MSGPIVRKYGFPNFEKIFGEREPQHGIDETAGSTSGTPETEPATAKAAAKKPEKKTKAPAKPKKAK